MPPLQGDVVIIPDAAAAAAVKLAQPSCHLGKTKTHGSASQTIPHLRE